MCRSDLNDGFSWSERTSRVGNVGGYGCKMRGSVPARRSGLDAEKKRGDDCGGSDGACGSERLVRQVSFFARVCGLCQREIANLTGDCIPCWGLTVALISYYLSDLVYCIQITVLDRMFHRAPVSVRIWRVGAQNYRNDCWGTSVGLLAAVKDAVNFRLTSPLPVESCTPPHTVPSLGIPPPAASPSWWLQSCVVVV